MKIFTLFNKVKFTSEQIILFGLLDNLPNEDSRNYNFKKESRYHNLIKFCKNNFQYVNKIDESDIIVLPYKFKNLKDELFIILKNLSQKYQKPLYCFYNDDYEISFNIPENIYLFRTSLSMLKKNKNEYPMIPIIPDYFDNYLLDKPKLSIGYCGHLLFGRGLYLTQLYQSNLETNFIIRNGFRAHGLNINTAKKEFIQNIKDNLFTFCYRGEGNFSYRFYEVLMMGRIPILINTNSGFPFWDKIKKEKIGIIINEVDLNNNKVNLINEIKKFYEENQNILLNIQENNRKIWKNYFTPTAFLNKLFNIQ